MQVRVLLRGAMRSQAYRATQVANRPEMKLPPGATDGGLLPMDRRPGYLALPRFGADRTVFHGPATSRLFSNFRSMA
ncbi:hypothetical protein CXQ81_15710 [Pseudomonas sp. 09C 129]|nr:hypothetical protein CXQ81_15710 [Pseudomonas sp. 09C 129]